MPHQSPRRFLAAMRCEPLPGYLALDGLAGRDPDLRMRWQTRASARRAWCHLAEHQLLPTTPDSQAWVAQTLGQVAA